MSPRDFESIAPYLVLVDLPRGHVLSMPGQVTEHCWFIETGIASMVIATRDGREIEASIVGYEGIVDVATILGEQETALRCFMQLPGHGYRISARALAKAVDESVTLLMTLHRYMYSVIVQIAQTALANACFNVEQRLARWLLMCSDRIVEEEIALTHEFLSVMLNVRRAGVTLAMQSLQRAGMLVAERRKIRIIDRSRLEELASDAYVLLG
jgi:CRP-like cAMP-binding protein